MKRHAFRVAAIAAVFIVFFAMMSAVRANDPRLTSSTPVDTRLPITFFIAEGNPETGYRSSDRELALWALEAWQRSAGSCLQIKATNESSALIRLYWAEPGGGEYGETRPIVGGGKQGAAVFIRPDMDSLGPDIAVRAGADPLLRDSIVYLTCLHELGHALGLKHTHDFRDIMYFFGYGGNIVQYFGRYRAQVHSRKDIAAVPGLSDADVARIRALYPAAE